MKSPEELASIARRIAIVQMRRSGQTCQEVAINLGTSRKRVEVLWHRTLLAAHEQVEVFASLLPLTEAELRSVQYHDMKIARIEAARVGDEPALNGEKV
jgi:transcriptional regulator